MIIRIVTEMSKQEIRNFLIQDTLTGKLATVKKDGSSHVVPFGLYYTKVITIVKILFLLLSKQKILTVIIE
jgi:hypothetical protein